MNRKGEIKGTKDISKFENRVAVNKNNLSYHNTFKIRIYTLSFIESISQIDEPLPVF